MERIQPPEDLPAQQAQPQLLGAVAAMPTGYATGRPVPDYNPASMTPKMAVPHSFAQPQPVSVFLCVTS